MSKPTAIGYLRTDVSGVTQRWHEEKMRALAKRYGYDLRKTLALSAKTENPYGELLTAAAAEDVEAVFVPSVDHLDGGVPRSLVKVADVITVEDEQTHARWGNGEVTDSIPAGLA